MSREIWVVDDEPGICRALDRSLKRRGLEVRTFLDSTAVDGALAMSPLPAMLLLDAQLGRSSALPWLRTLRTSVPELIVVLMSGGMEQRAVDQLIRDRLIDSFLEKPWDEDALFKVVDAAIAAVPKANRAQN